MKASSLFLRAGCVLPDGIELIQQRISGTWSRVEDTLATALDLRIRDAGWHFMWMEEASSRRGLGRTAASAISSATSRALENIRARFNAAEVESITVKKFPGFQLATVTLHPRQIQPATAL